MKEMLLVGRGGEGVVLASQLLAETFVRAGCWAQSFPEFKAERRGAPISAFLRWDENAPIHRRYAVRTCDVLAVISPAPPSPRALADVRDGGLVVVNREARLPIAGPFTVARVPASRIARDDGVLSSEGRPMGNVAVLGACVRMLLPDGLEHLEAAIASRMGPAAAALNVHAAREGYARCVHQRPRPDDVPLEVAHAAATRLVDAVEPEYPVSTADSVVVQTGTWSLDRPVVGEACSGCAVCAVFCPEGAVTREDGHVAIDYAHCKGCGICQTVCPIRDALRMEEVVA